MGEAVTDPVKPVAHRVKFGEVLKQRAFSVPFVAEAQSVVGDQLARVALSVLVFDRTGSPVATAFTYAATFLPTVLGGVILAGVGDRFGKRTVLVGCDLIRAALFAAMAISGLSLWVVATLVVIAVLIGPAFAAAELAYLAAALEPDEYRTGTGLRLITNQAAQVLGFAAGGVLVAALRPSGALLIDAASYVLSAALIGGALPRQNPGAIPTPAGRSLPARTHRARRAMADLWRSPRLRRLIGLCWLAGFFLVPEGLAIPFAHQIHARTTVAGLLLAAIPLGSVIGAIAIVRVIGDRRRERVAWAMAIGAGVPLVICALRPSWPVVLIAWALSGAFTAYQVDVTPRIVALLPEVSRARLVGLVFAGLVGAQGLGFALFGLVAAGIGAGNAIAVAGATGSTLAVALAARRESGARG